MTGKEKSKTTQGTIYITGLEKNQLTLELGGRGEGGGWFQETYLWEKKQTNNELGRLTDSLELRIKGQSWKYIWKKLSKQMKAAVIDSWKHRFYIRKEFYETLCATAMHK